MTNVTFYLLPEDSKESSQAHLLAACDLAAQCYRKKQRCLIYCSDQSAAESFDELLWKQPLESFVAHNLTGEGPANGTPIEICWQPPTQFSRGVLINLTANVAEFSHRFKQVYDFVPAEEQLKQQARERYKHYRAAGYQLDTLPASKIIERNDG